MLCTSLAISANGAILIDFGNDASYRGRSVTNPDGNGNYWNCVDSSVYWTDLLNHDGTVSPVDFGFSSAAGNDSYNGPAGPTTSGNDYTNAVIDAAALGDLGIKAAAFDYYVSSTFTIQQLDPSKMYTLTFYGSHKYNVDNVTVYTVYTSNDYAAAVASTNLLVGINADHNSNTVVSIIGVYPQFADSIWVGFEGESGSLGYLNAMKIEIVPEPVVLSVGLLGVFLFMRRK
jgi:hypothetical protein